MIQHGRHLSYAIIQVNIKLIAGRYGTTQPNGHKKEGQVERAYIYIEKGVQKNTNGLRVYAKLVKQNPDNTTGNAGGNRITSGSEPDREGLQANDLKVGRLR